MQLFMTRKLSHVHTLCMRWSSMSEGEWKKPAKRYGETKPPANWHCNIGFIIGSLASIIMPTVRAGSRVRSSKTAQILLSLKIHRLNHTVGGPSTAPSIASRAVALVVGRISGLFRRMHFHYPSVIRRMCQWNQTTRANRVWCTQANLLWSLRSPQKVSLTRISASNLLVSLLPLYLSHISSMMSVSMEIDAARP